jgi:hypothetical protein
MQALLVVNSILMFELRILQIRIRLTRRPLGSKKDGQTFFVLHDKGPRVSCFSWVLSIIYRLNETLANSVL